MRMVLGTESKHEDHTQQRTARLTVLRSAVIDRDLSAIPRHQQCVVGQVDDAAEPQHLLDRILSGRARLFVHDAKHFPQWSRRCLSAPPLGRSASPFRRTTWPSASVAITATPMLASRYSFGLE